MKRSTIEQRLVYGVGAFSAALGAVLILTAERFLTSPTFIVTFALARPEAWGALFVIGAGLMVLEFRQGAGQLPALALTIVFSAFATTAAFAPANGSGVFSATVVYLGFAYFAATCIPACGHPTGR